MRNLEPLGNHVLVEPAVLPEKSVGGIVLPEQARGQSNEGIVLAVGDGKLDYQGRLVAPRVKPGDTVVFTWLHGRDVMVNGKKLKVLDADELLGVFR